jgi:hypothetical protein
MHEHKVQSVDSRYQQIKAQPASTAAAAGAPGS